MANYMCYNGDTRANKICVLNSVLCACLRNKYIKIEQRKLSGQKITWETMYAPRKASFYICIKFNLSNSAQQLIFF